MNRTVLTTGLVLLLTTLLLAATPERSKGISMHMLPKRVADLSGSKWGLTVTGSGHLTPDAGSITLQTTNEFLAFVQKQSSSVKENGVWIVTMHPDAYSEQEKRALCRNLNRPAFLLTVGFPRFWNGGAHRSPGSSSTPMFIGLSGRSLPTRARSNSSADPASTAWLGPA
jgi:hypothetical protein